MMVLWECCDGAMRVVMVLWECCDGAMGVL